MEPLNTTDTPRTDAAFGQGRHGAMKIPYETSCKLERKLAASKAEVERLEANLKRAIEIADRLRSKIFTDGWLDEDDELYQIKATLNPETK